MRFLADENVSRFVVDRLRAAGFDVTAVGLTSSGASDADVLAMARREGRVLVTEDRDFGELVVRQRLEVPGVVLVELDRLSSAGEAERVATTVSANADRLAGNLFVIEPGRVRIRPLAKVSWGLRSAFFPHRKVASSSKHRALARAWIAAPQ